MTKLTFRTRADGVTSGGRLNRKRGVVSFGLFASLFAGGCAIFYETGGDIVRKFGLKMHVGSGTMASKTEAIFYPAGTGPHEDGDTTPLTRR